jgi:LytS/YehU family sensor histidine kinase
VYRYLLKDNNIQNLVCLKDELAFTESYLYIIKERFEDALIVSTTINEELLNKRLPPLVLQILIENAIKHNILTAEEPLKITIFTDKYQSLTVENILQPKQSTEDSLGIGLENIKGRYKLIGDKEIKILQTQHSFSVTVPLLD